MTSRFVTSDRGSKQPSRRSKKLRTEPRPPLVGPHRRCPEGERDDRTRFLRCGGGESPLGSRSFQLSLQRSFRSGRARGTTRSRGGWPATHRGGGTISLVGPTSRLPVSPS